MPPRSASAAALKASEGNTLNRSESSSETGVSPPTLEDSVSQTSDLLLSENEALKREVTSLKKQVRSTKEEYEGQLKALEQELERVKKQFEAAQSQRTRVLRELSKKDDELADVKQQLSTASAVLQERAGNTNALEHELVSMEDKLRELRTEKAKLEEINSRYRADLSAHQSDGRDMANEMASARRHAQREVESMQGTVRELEASVAKEQEKRREIERKVEAEKNRYIELQESVSGMDRKLLEAERYLMALLEKNPDLPQTIQYTMEYAESEGGSEDHSSSTSSSRMKQRTVEENVSSQYVLTVLNDLKAERNRSEKLASGLKHAEEIGSAAVERADALAREMNDRLMDAESSFEKSQQLTLQRLREAEEELTRANAGGFSTRPQYSNVTAESHYAVEGSTENADKARVAVANSWEQFGDLSSRYEKSAHSIHTQLRNLSHVLQLTETGTKSPKASVASALRERDASSNTQNSHSSLSPQAGGVSYWEKQAVEKAVLLRRAEGYISALEGALSQVAARLARGETLICDSEQQREKDGGAEDPLMVVAGSVHALLLSYVDDIAISAIATRARVAQSLVLRHSATFADTRPIAHWMRTLTALDLSGTAVNDNSISVLSSLPSLESLALGGCLHLSVGALRVLPLSLKKLDLQCTKFGDDALCELVDSENVSTTLTHLNLYRTKVTDVGCGHLAKLHALTYLNLSSTGVTDIGVSMISGLPGLNSLDISMTNCSDGIVESLRRAPGLRSVTMYGNTGSSTSQHGSTNSKKGGAAPISVGGGAADSNHDNLSSPSYAGWHARDFTSPSQASPRPPQSPAPNFARPSSHHL